MTNYTKMSTRELVHRSEHLAKVAHKEYFSEGNTQRCQELFAELEKVEAELDKRMRENLQEISAKIVRADKYWEKTCHDRTKWVVYITDSNAIIDCGRDDWMGHSKEHAIERANEDLQKCGYTIKEVE